VVNDTGTANPPAGTDGIPNSLKQSATQGFPYSVWRKSFAPGSPVNFPRR
jgi:hypothetical protein